MYQQESNNSTSDLDIAIIAMSGRFPGATNVDSLWQNLKNGVESISTFSEAELLASNVDPNLFKDLNYVAAGGVLSDIEMFDASFFGFSAREAEVTDPQQRLFLECAWEALEVSGYNSENYQGAIGIFAGIGINTYLLNNLYFNRELIKLVGEYQLSLGNDKDFLSTRVAHKLNLTGPAVTVQTACSTSLVAVHLACQSLLSGECDMTLAGGVSLHVPHRQGYLYQEGMISSPDGHCRAFDVNAKGAVRGNGVGIVVLKRLADAIADGDPIQAIIKGSAINNDGAVKVGYTSPSIEGQAAAIADAHAVSGVDVETITYIETHGTGTKLGDPIEIAALTKAFQLHTHKKGFCAIGSVKTNLGHLDTAAGVTGLIKTVLALKHKLIPPSLHFQTPNPQIDFANSPFYVNTKLSPWTNDNAPLRAGVSSFGIGGTNAHVIVEQAPTIATSGESRSWQLLLLSSKTDSTLNVATANLADHLQQHSHLNLADVAYTLSCGRKAFPYRRMLVCQSLNEAAIALKNLDPEQVFSNSSQQAEQTVVFMFPGQGTQYVNMGLELYETEPAFGQEVDLCAEILLPHLGLDIRQILYPKQQDIEQVQKQLQQTAIAQPCLFVIEYALAKLWNSWGIFPQAMIGHSIGEYVAACLAEVFSLEAALSLVAVRGRLMQQLPSGAMLAVPLGAAKVQHLMSEDLSIAAINEPERCVISGPIEAIETLHNKLTAQGLVCRRLHTSHAFHSSMMEPILSSFSEQVQQVSLHIPKIPYISNITGTWIATAQALDPNYWVQHLRQTVQFAQGIGNLLANSKQILLEVGPGRTLSSFAKRHSEQIGKQLVVTSMCHPQENQSDVAFLLTALGHLWLGGAKVDWAGFYNQQQRHRLFLPTYPFERQRYWIEPLKSLNDSDRFQILEKKAPDMADWFYTPSWKRLSISTIQPSHSPVTTILFIDECRLGEELAKRLQQQGYKVVAIKKGQSFQKQGEHLYTINPQKADDYYTLLNELDTLNFSPTTIVHLWTVTSNHDFPSRLASIDIAQNLGLHSLIFLAQAIGKQNWENELQLIVVSNNLQELIGDEVLYPEKATVLGAVKTIPQEYPHIKCRHVDVVVSDDNIQKLIEQLLKELTTQSTDITIAYRGSHRWVQIFEPIRLSQPTTTQPRLKQKGVYLITGGLGGMGLVFAEHLAKTVNAKLILLGRSNFPPREDWENWLNTHACDDEISEKIQKIKDMEKSGTEVLVVCADLANQEQMQLVMTQAQECLGQINGIFHAAGIVDYGGVIQTRTKEITDRVLAAKLRGTLVLEQLLKHLELDFFILCSSLGNILYQLKFGQVGYNAANEFIDAFAYQQQNSQRQTFTVCINWDDWQDVGMSVKARQKSNEKLYTIENQKLLSLLPVEGIEVILRILANLPPGFPRIIVSLANLTARMQSLEKLDLKLLDVNIKIKQQHSRPQLSNIYLPPRNTTEQNVAEIFQSLLGIDAVGVYDNFFELGGDSLIATQLLSRLNQNFAQSLPINTVFIYPTIAQIAENIDKTVHSKPDNWQKIDQMLQLVEELSEEEMKIMTEELT